MSNGRLNEISMYVPTNDYVGFSKCLNITRAGTYYIGFAADADCKLRVNGIDLVEFSATTPETYTYWHVFPYYFHTGLNVVEFQAKGGIPNQAMGFEIYYPKALSSIVGAIDASAAGTIFSSLERLNTYFDLGTTMGYTCPVGMALDLCTYTAATCSTIIRTDPTITAGTVNISGTTTITGSVITTGTTMISGTTTVTGSSIVSAITFTCCSTDTHCGDNRINFEELLTEPLSGISSIEDFEYIITSELIDAKDRQTLSSYPTLRALYDRYMNSSGYCSTNSSRFDYDKMNKFAGLVGNYWVDLIEQVIPSTTIWGSTKIYTNTIFDNQKFKYKPYSLHFGDNAYGSVKVLSPCVGVQYVDSNTTTLVGDLADTVQFRDKADVHLYNRVYIIQNNSGSEFIGMVTRPGQNMIQECSLNVNVVAAPTDYALSNGSATALVMGNYGPVTYAWSNGATTQSIYDLSAGTYSVTITDTYLSGCSTTVDVVIPMNPESYLSMSMESTNTSFIALRLDSGTQPVWVDWGDGSLSAGTGLRLLTHLYGSPYSGPVNVNAYNNFSGVTRFETLSATTMAGYTGGTDTALHLRYSTDELSKFTNLATWVNTALERSTVRGDVVNIPRHLTTISVSTQNTGAGAGDYLYGSTYNLPTGTTIISIGASNIISGNTSGLPRPAVEVYIEGNNTISGNTTGLPSGTTFMQIAGNNTIGGNVSGLPRTLTYLNIRGNNTISGDTIGLPTGLTTSLLIHGSNSISGSLSNLPTNLVVVDILGTNTLSGTTYQFPRGLQFIEIDGDNTITGDVLGLPTGATFVYMLGNNTISGRLSDVISDVKYLQLEPCSLSGYTSGKTWTNSIGLIRLFPNTSPYAFSTAEVDSILIDLTGATFMTSAEVDIQGTSQPRSNSAQVLAALTILTGAPNNVVVVTN
jgi:hypothetical protein